jgi:hypothetical protein
MESLLGFQLDAWDYATFAAMVIVGAGFLGLLALFLGLPGPVSPSTRPAFPWQRWRCC